MRDIQVMLQQVLAPHHVQVRFGRSALGDLEHFHSEQQRVILALIIARAKKGPLLKPHGIATPLRGELRGFSKIKPKSIGLRIVYRPSQVGEDAIMEIIAIGPRDGDRVYRTAARRLLAFQSEMERER